MVNGRLRSGRWPQSPVLDVRGGQRVRFGEGPFRDALFGGAHDVTGRDERRRVGLFHTDLR